MQTGVSIEDHDRVSVPRAERSMLGYVWGTVGGALLLTVAMVLVVVYSSLSPVRAEDARVIRGPGKGLYDTSIGGAAAGDIKGYMDRTWVECEDLNGHGRCNLNASTESVQVMYAGEYAAAFLAYDADTGNHPATRLVLWKRQSDGRYATLGTNDQMAIVTDAHLADDNGTLRLSGIVQGPNDGFCCPTSKATYDLAFVDGKLSVTPAKKPKRPVNLAIAALSANTLAATNMMAKPQPKSRISGFDFSHNNYAGEAPFVFFHNGSEMMVFPDHGIIAYKQPKPEIADVVHETDILFSGKIKKSGVTGIAYVFKKGCPPLPYRVTGAGYNLDRKDAPPVMILRGLAPVHAKTSCAVIGTTANGSNNVLKFEPAGAYAEDALEEETHSGYRYEHARR